MKQNLHNNFFRLRGLLGSLLLVLLPLLGWGQVVISQVYTGGGLNSGSPTFNQDYVELFNRSAATQSIGGFTIQFGGGTSASNFTSSAAIPAGTTIPAGGYYLIGLAIGSAAGSTLSPTPNFASTSVALATASGKVALVTNSALLTGANPATGPTVVDFVGYGVANGYEGSGSTSTTLTLTTAAFRMSGGCTDINQNAFDFGVAAPAPRNALTTAAPCLPPATITTQDPSPAPICATGTNPLSVPYTVAAGTAAGTYLVQLSNAAGSFANAITLTTSSTSSPLAVIIPATVAGGTGYLVRAVVGGNIGSPNPTPFTINNVAVAPTTDQTLATNASGTALTATETPAGTSRQWYYSTTAGSGYSNTINGATGTMYTPSFVAPGTYYVVVRTAFNTCSVTSNEVKVTVTAPSITTGAVAAGPYCVGQNTPVAVSIPFTVSSAFAAGNVFTAYMASNSFNGPKIPIGTLSGTGSGTIMGTLAQSTNLNTHTDYRIRVEASSPAAIGTDNGTDLSVASYLDNEVAVANSVAGNGQATLNFTAPATCVTNVIVTIKAGTAVGTKPVAGTTYAPGAGSGTVAFGTGTMLSSGQYVVYNGPATGSITVTGLTNNTRYIFGTFTTNGGATGVTGYSNGSTASVIPVIPATLMEVLVPQYLSGHATNSSTHPTRLPYVWRVSLGNLAPSTTYKYYTAGRAATDPANNGGAGIPIETQTASAFVRKSGGPGLDNSSSSFTTDASGAYTGWFGLEPSPDARYNDQALVYPMVVLNGGDGLNVPTQFLATISPVTALNLSSATTGATGVRGNSFGTASNFVLTYDNNAGTGRPLAGTWLENDGSVNTASYAGFYGSVETVAGAYGLLTPNANASGIRRIEQRALADGSLVGCAATSATGTWEGGAATASPSGGTTALVLTSGDTPFIAPILTSLSTSAVRPGQTITLTGTGFAASPNATVVFAPGSPVVAASVNAAGTSLTVVVPSGAGAGTVAVRTSCGTSNALATSLAPASAPGVLLFEDDFDYAAGQPLAANGWSQVAGTGGSIATTAGNGLLSTYPQGAALSSLPAATSTKAALVAGADGPLYRAGARPASATTLYAAAVVNFSDTQATSEYFLAFVNAASAGTGSPTYRSQVYATRASATTFTFELALAGRPTTTNTSAFSLNTNYLLVVKTATTTTGAETTSLYVLPAGADFGTEPTTPLLSVTGTTPLASPLNAVVLRQNGTGNATLTIDGIRLATGWGAAVGQPYYAAPGATINSGNYYSLTAANADVLTPTGGAVNVENSLTLSSGIIASTAAALLTLYPGTSVVGGATTSYVSGPLARLTGPGAATTVFPIGSGANYRPLVLTATAQTGSATYVATQTEGNAGQSFSASNGLGSAPLLRVSTQRTYTLTTSNPNSGFSGTITLPFEPNDYVNNPADAGLVIAKRDATAANPADNGRWTNLGRSASTGMSTGPGGIATSGSLTSATFSGFSDFTLGATNDVSGSNVFTVVNPLPVQLTSFLATRSAGGVQVAWATASEKNSDYFVVERALDGRTFAAIAQVAAHGTTALRHTYASPDAAAPAALLYYRLRQVDLGGTVAFSPVVTVAAPDGSTAELALIPNPARESVSFFAAAPTAYGVRNALGQLVRSGTTVTGINYLLVSGLPAGVYFFELHSAAGRVVRKLVKE